MGVSPIFSAKVIKFGRSHISQTETKGRDCTGFSLFLL